jgi:hypothetical protein
VCDLHDCVEKEGGRRRKPVMPHGWHSAEGTGCITVWCGRVPVRVCVDVYVRVCVRL